MCFDPLGSSRSDLNTFHPNKKIKSRDKYTLEYLFKYLISPIIHFHSCKTL